MPASPHIRPSEDKDAAAVLVELLKPGAWIPPAQARWLPVIEALLEAFLRHFDRAVLAQLLDRQRALPPSASAATHAARMAGQLTALHKICQMLARNPRLPAEARAALAPLESLPPEAIPDTAVSAAVALAVQARPDLELDPEIRKLLAAAWPMSSFLTLDGITHQLDPDFNAWLLPELRHLKGARD